MMHHDGNVVDTNGNKIIATQSITLATTQACIHEPSWQTYFASSGKSTPLYYNGAGKAVKGGRESSEKGDLSYSASQHLFLLQTMLPIKDLFGALESSPGWKRVYQVMVLWQTLCFH
jgi:hypothetical protein